MPDETLRRGRVCSGENAGAAGLAPGREPVMDVVRIVPPQSGVAVLGVVPRKGVGAVRPAVFERTKAIGKARMVLDRLELAFGKRFVRDVQTGMGLGDPEVGEEEGHRFGDHDSATKLVMPELIPSLADFTGPINDAVQRAIGTQV